MYDRISGAALAQILNQFSAPIFVLECDDQGQSLRFVTLNSAMEMTVGCTSRMLLGRAFRDVVSHRTDGTSKQAMQCLRTGEITRFHATFLFTPEATQWDVTLQAASTPTGRTRIIATCIKEPQEQTASAQVTAFDDIQYLSTIADFQLQNLIAMLKLTQPGTCLTRGQNNGLHACAACVAPYNVLWLILQEALKRHSQAAVYIR